MRSLCGREPWSWTIAAHDEPVHAGHLVNDRAHVRRVGCQAVSANQVSVLVKVDYNVDDQTWLRFQWASLEC